MQVQILSPHEAQRQQTQKIVNYSTIMPPKVELRLYSYVCRIVLLCLPCTAYLSNVAFRAVSPLIQQTDLTNILAGQRSIECVLKEARRLRQREGMDAARSFLDEVPELYLWQTKKIKSILSQTPEIKQCVIVDAHMSTLAYEIQELNQCHVVEVAEKALISVKEQLIARHGTDIPCLASSLERVTSTDHVNWSVPTLLLMPDLFDPVPPELCKRSAVICTAKNSFDTSQFRHVTVRRYRDRIQVAASGFKM